jgi:hypothetical protein
MKRWLMISAAAVALSSGAAQADYTLHVLHINDFHSRVEPINKYDSTCDAETEAKNECFGGVARVASKINELRDQLKADGQNVVVLDAGDQYQGSLFYTTYKGKDTVEFMNAIGFDAMAVGNHEFDDGPGGLQILAEGVKFPVVSGNLDLSQSPELKDKVGDVLTLEVGGEKIGIVSALAMDTPETAAPGDKVIFMDDMESLKADVQELTDAGVTKILALTHEGYKRDQEIAAEVAGIDALVGGHSHTLLGDMEGAEGPYPTMVKAADGTRFRWSPPRLWQISGPSDADLGRQWQADQGRGPADPAGCLGQAGREDGRAGQGNGRPHRGTQAKARGRYQVPPSMASAAPAGRGNARWAMWSPRRCWTGSRIRASPSPSRMAAGCGPRSRRAGDHGRRADGAAIPEHAVHIRVAWRRCGRGA